MMGSRSPRCAAALAPCVLVVLGACAHVQPTSPARPDPVRDSAKRATSALIEEDFTTARRELIQLASRCESGDRGRRAILLLAAAELDPGNPDGSPERAARLAAGYLLLPGAEPEDMAIARSLYRAASDRMAPGDPRARELPVLAARFDVCDAEAPLPPIRLLPFRHPSTTAARVLDLEAALAAKSDSIQALRADASGLRARLEALTTELARVTELLTRDAGRFAPGGAAGKVKR